MAEGEELLIRQWVVIFFNMDPLSLSIFYSAARTTN